MSVAAPAGFGEPSAEGRSAPGFDRASVAIALVTVAALVAALLWAATSGSGTTASRPRLFAASLVLDGTSSLTVVQLATAQVTVQLPDIFQQVDASAYGQVQAVPVAGGTFLVNRSTGTFNFLGDDNYVVDASGGGVGLGHLAGVGGAAGFADGADAYIVRYAPRSSVALVDAGTVAEAAAATSARHSRAPTKVAPQGLISLPGAVPDHAGAAVSSGGDLWALVGRGRSCSLVAVRPAGGAAGGLAGATRATGLPCGQTGVAAAGGRVGVAGPAGVTVFGPGGRSRHVAVPALASAREVLPVAGSTGRLWWLARLSSGWVSVGVTPGGAVTGPETLRGVPGAADPAAPVISDGAVYTLDRQAAGQPDLWVVDPATGAVGTVAGEARYPAASASEQASFAGAQVLVDGPRVVYNNPGSLLAVVVFTSGSHPPVVIDKSSAVDVDAAGPAAIARRAAAAGRGTHHKGTKRTKAPAPAHPVAGASPTVDEQLSCAHTTQKPYAPQIQPVTASSESALVSWSYDLLDEQDCEPDSWAVRVTALGAPQPSAPTTMVRGQQQAELTGLRPSTDYSVVVTAIINRQSTTSAPVTFRTTAQGPAAPSSVSATVTPGGSWHVTWAPCQGSTCYVAAQQWYVIATACGGSFAGQPPDVEVPGSQDSATIDAAGLGLLGTSMSFSVEGGAGGLRGNPTSDHACTQSWRPPEASAITVTGSATPSSAGGQTVTATVDVTPLTGTAASTLVYGSQQTTFDYVLKPAGGASGPTFQNLGSSQPTAVFDQVPAGTPYVASVQIAPSGHPSASVTRTSATFSTVDPWPSVQPSVSSVSRSDDLSTGTVTLTFPSALVAADQYVANDTSMDCDGAAMSFGSPSLDGLALTLTVPDLATFGGTSCSVDVGSLTDETADNPYGPGRSPAVQPVDFGFPPAPSYSFDAVYGTTDCGLLGCQPDVSVTPAAAGYYGAEWSVTAAGSGVALGGCTNSVDGQPQPSQPVVVALPITCSGPFSVTVSWQYYGQTVTASPSPTGTVPTTTTTSTTSSTTTSTTTTTTTAGGAAGSSRPPSTALAVARPAPADGSGQTTLVVIVVLVALGSGAVARRRRPPSRKDTP